MYRGAFIYRGENCYKIYYRVITLIAQTYVVNFNIYSEITGIS